MAKVLSSISGNVISAASAGYAPTNSADVSAIASAYQVVSATGTQLYVGTAYVTSVNSAPLSASRAGNAANASMANSAYYDGTGRLISSLPDAATVSAIASSYADDKLDKTAEVVTATAGDGTYVTSINGMGVSGQGGGGGGAAFPVEYTAGSCSASLETGYFVSTSRPSLTLSSTGTSIYPRFIVRNGTGAASKGSYYLSDAFEFTTGAAGDSGAKVLRVDPQQVSSKNFLLYGPSGRTTYGTLELRGSNSSAYVCIGSTNAEHTNFVRPSSISSWWDVHDTVSANSATWGQGGVDSATVSAIASSYAGSAASSKQDSSAMSAYALSSDVSGVIDTVATNSASWGAGATLPITGSTGDDSASYGGGSLEFTRYDTAGEPDIRTATLSPDSLWLNYTLDGNDYTSMSLTEGMLDFTDSDGDHVVDAFSIDTWNSAVDTVANNSASWGGGGGGGGVVTATGSASATSGLWPVTTSYLISSINGSAILPYGYSALSSNSANWNNARTAVTANSANWNSAYSLISGVTALMDSI